MSLRANTQILVRLNSFQAIEDRLTNATIKLKTKISEVTDKPDPQSQKFESASFLINETKVVPLSDFMSFQLSSDCFPNLASEVELQVELWILGLTNAEEISSDRYGKLCSSKVRFSNPQDPTNLSVSLFFERGCFSAVNLSFHSSLVGIEFKKMNCISPSMNENLLPSSTATSIEQFILQITNKGEAKASDDFYIQIIQRFKIFAEKQLKFVRKMLESTRQFISYQKCVCHSSESENIFRILTLRVAEMISEFSRHSTANRFASEGKKKNRFGALLSDLIGWVKINRDFFFFMESMMKKCYQHVFCFLRDAEVLGEAKLTLEKVRSFPSEVRDFFKINFVKSSIEDTLFISQTITEVDYRIAKVIKSNPSPVSFHLVEEHLKNNFSPSLTKTLSLVKKVYPSAFLVDYFRKNSIMFIQNPSLATRRSVVLSQVVNEAILLEEPLFVAKEDIQNDKSHQNSIPYHHTLQKPNHSHGKKVVPFTIRENKTSLVVLVHGYHGSEFDLRLMKGFLTHFGPQIQVLVSKSNIKNPEASVLNMGCNLAEEVLSVLASNPNIQHLNFYGHSLGGVIIRAALPHLIDHRKKMRTFVTTGSPHLGRKDSDSPLFDIGFNILQSLSSSVVLRQLALKDESDIRKTVMYNLSKEKSFEWFQNYFFIASREDMMVPFESARFEVADFMKKQEYLEMITSIRTMLAEKNVTKINVRMKTSNSNMDWNLGRRPHLQFIENGELLRNIATRILPFLV